MKLSYVHFSAIVWFYRDALKTIKEILLSDQNDFRIKPLCNVDTAIKTLFQGNKAINISSNGAATLEHFSSSVGNIKVIPRSCSTGSCNMLLWAVQCTIRSVTLMVILAAYLLPWRCVSHSSASRRGKKKMHVKTKKKGKMSDAEKWRRLFVCIQPQPPPLTGLLWRQDRLKARLDASEMLQISPILVSLFSAIYSRGKVCRSVFTRPILHCHPTLIRPVTWCETPVWF